MKSIRVKSNQIELQIQDYAHSGEAIIFLHFSGANLMMWQRIISYFEDQYRLILVDLRGHGKSDKPATGYHMDNMARDIFGMMQQLNLDQAHIIGSSLGAEVGLSLAANYPDQVISLACDGALSSEYGPYGTWEGSEAEFEEFVASQLEKMRNAPETFYPSVDALVESTQEVLEKYNLWNEYVEAMERYGAYQVDEGKFTKAFRKPAKENYFSHYFHYRFEDYYPKIKCPLMMLAGEDVLENEQEKVAMERLRDLTVRGEIKLVSGWEHPYGWLLDPDAMCASIMDFLIDQGSNHVEVER